MGSARVGFAVIYRWRLRSGSEDGFRAAWDKVTRQIMAHRGGLGSRLHRSEDGLWTAYAQWPDRKTWEDSQGMDPVDPAASGAMKEAIEESFPPILLDPVNDHLI
jgi:quinol monooxygenase YgiN